MAKLESYQDLEVWKQTKDLVKIVYKVTSGFPREEQYGLTNQLRRAALSVPSNIAEGCGRNHVKDSLQFFFVARGGLYEIETQTIIAFELDYLDKTQKDLVITRLIPCKRLLNGFINYFQGITDQQRTTIHEQLEAYGNSDTIEEGN